MSKLSQKESETLEFKSSFGKEVIETIVAFSNAHGGKIVLGYNDKKKIIGVNISNESIPQWINEIKQSTQPAIFPDINIIEIENKKIVEIIVDEFPLKPVSYKNRYYSRKQNSNHFLSIEEITELRFTSLNYSFDSFAVKTKFNELDKNAVSFFSKRLIEAGRFHSSENTKDDFIKLGFIVNGKLTRAAQLLFGMHNTGIHIGRFKTRDTIIDDIVIRSPLVLAVEEAMIFIKRNIRLGYEFTGELKRKEIWQFPLQAIRESLLNAIVHKDYPHISLDITDDTMIFTIEYFDKGTEKGTEKISLNQQLILDNIAQNAHITIEELASIVGIAASKIKENLSKLKAKGLIKRIGSDRGGYWRVIK